MRVVLGLSVTASSAVWVLVDTYDGSIIADEVVPLESVTEIARAASRSVQDFALQSKRDIDGVRLVWDEQGRQHGIRLRTKLRLFGFDTVETVSEDAAREGRNRTARHIAPHLVLAYGAARADLDDADRSLMQKLADKVPGRPAGPQGGAMPVILDRAASVRAAGSDTALRVSDRTRHLLAALPGGMASRAAAAVFAVAVTGVVGYALFGVSPHQVPATAAAEVAVPAPPAAMPPAVPMPAPQAVVAPAPAPAPVITPAEAEPVAAVEDAPAPDYAVDEPGTATGTAAADTTTADVAAVPQTVEAPVAAVVPDTDPLAAVAATIMEPGAAAPGEPHLTGVGPVAGPVLPIAQATPETVNAAPVAPAPGGPIGQLFRALP